MMYKKGDLLEGIGTMSSIKKFVVTHYDPSSIFSVKGKIFLSDDPTLKSLKGWINPKSFVKVLKKGDLVSGNVPKCKNLKLGVITKVTENIIRVKILQFNVDTEQTKSLKLKEMDFDRWELIEFNYPYKKGAIVKGESYHEWVTEGEIIEEGVEFIKIKVLQTDNKNQHQIGKEWSGLNRFFTIIK